MSIKTKNHKLIYALLFYFTQYSCTNNSVPNKNSTENISVIENFAGHVIDENCERFIPDRKTAIQVAECVLILIYGKETIKAEQPLIALLDNNVWKITGSLPKTLRGDMSIGGVVEIDLLKATGQVLRIIHGK
ncbi:NTF2 fold immunity protein [Thiolinea disciformis]|uniref:NTF2 fold immunity protein n=1 Tax=Thiolinea disciformis TaxID=125614 RepID=UPI0003780266|nr:NTF2 fold immunity protein [Thiolinea disciformis]